MPFDFVFFFVFWVKQGNCSEGDDDLVLHPLTDIPPPFVGWKISSLENCSYQNTW